RNGLLEPIVVTRDRVILSGHRRYLACRIAGVDRVRCRVVDMLSTDDEFLPALVSYNRQRVKSNEELLREEVVQTDPDEAYKALVQHRAKRSAVAVNTVEVRDRKPRSKISNARQPFLRAALDILEARRDFWPLSDRSVHYALLNDPP